MAYPNPASGPMAYLLDPSQREMLVESVNGALMGKLPDNLISQEPVCA